LQELKHAAPVEPPPRKRKEYSPLVPWRMTITHASCNLANTRFVEGFLFYMQTEDCRIDLFQSLKETEILCVVEVSLNHGETCSSN